MRLKICLKNIRLAFGIGKCVYICTPKTVYNAEVAQLVEHDLAKVGVASSSLVFRSAFREPPVSNKEVFFQAPEW